jgi:hypothetical protein
MNMGLITWIAISIIILAIIGIGWQAFISGVFNGAKKLGITTPTMKNITEKARQYISNLSNSNSGK